MRINSLEYQRSVDVVSIDGSPVQSYRGQYEVVANVTEYSPNGFKAEGSVVLPDHLQKEVFELFGKIEKHFESEAK